MHHSKILASIKLKLSRIWQYVVRTSFHPDLTWAKSDSWVSNNPSCIVHQKLCPLYRFDNFPKVPIFLINILSNFVTDSLWTTVLDRRVYSDHTANCGQFWVILPLHCVTVVNSSCSNYTMSANFMRFFHESLLWTEGYSGYTANCDQFWVI